jgi:dephospho-CoA kinase
MTPPLFVVALTGGIGSGKTTVANLFAMQGVPLIDADVIAREITEPDQIAFAEIITHFKETTLLADGKLNRAKLREIIFTKPHERTWLENLLHPLIRDEIKRRLLKITSPYCLLIIPLLFEVQPYAFINRILVVDSSTHEQIKRVSERDKTPVEQIEAILNAQINRAERLARAHDVIHNDGKLEDIKPQVQTLHQMYLELAARL